MIRYALINIVYTITLKGATVMTPRQQQLWARAGRLAYRDVAKYTEGKFTDLFYRVALDYYTKLLLADPAVRPSSASPAQGQKTR